MGLSLSQFFTIVVGFTLVNNFILSRFLGLCPFINSSDRTDKAFGMGTAVVFVMALASFVTHLLYTQVLRADAPLVASLLPEAIRPYGLDPILRTASYILVIACLVQLVETFMRKSIPALYRSLGIFLPLITTNCAVLGVTLINTSDAPEQISLLAATLQGLFGGVGFTFAMLLMSGIRERIALVNVPTPLRGAPIAFICTGLMALAFLGFAGMA
jgi:electron transport complex protein RnfA